MKIAVIGATGLVGGKILRVLEERKVAISEFIPVASERSVGRKIEFNNTKYDVISIEDALKRCPDISIFSAGSEISQKWAPKFASANSHVIDNSSAWRMNDDVPLIVPEINGNALTKKNLIIANPNCSTIQLVMALSPLHNAYKIKRLVISTYQSVSGSGAKAVNQLLDERKEIESDKEYPFQIDLNILPHAGDFNEEGYTSEEMKLVNETNKILNANINTTATVVRVPVITCHSESVNIEFENDFTVDEVKYLLESMPGVVILDLPDANIYPMPILAVDKDEVMVGRIRRDFSQPRTLNMWVVADNLRKGAATNAVQIVQYLISKGMVN
ncbi:MAG: aspartate-semialdehyde dehydrogenase [Bacteroidales bacterium]|nr:aspartate-semialdehyde dehydrogenase [Lentimicrobiaceae bacterium]MDG1135650.1 aspartate-semialdehyde dehydrogenase [Bacteroidales bacterium]MDG1901844.1 aspartate-semialdehyde dehydrogenase [Bacteroidales bacterium]MDG2080473.1 aspartate-semialdehyde dehydrogenase [Bacteroidales bacterium]|tara:strand:- start:2956 stop:3945 length:990 start_codon:yes stop_codon:yes gene_type:complete